MGSQMSSNHLFGNFLTVLYKLWKLATLSAMLAVLEAPNHNFMVTEVTRLCQSCEFYGRKLSASAPHLQIEIIQVVCVIPTVHGSRVGLTSCCRKILVIPEQKGGEELCCWVSAFRSTVFRHRAVLCHR